MNVKNQSVDDMSMQDNSMILKPMADYQHWGDDTSALNSMRTNNPERPGGNGGPNIDQIISDPGVVNLNLNGNGHGHGMNEAPPTAYVNHAGSNMSQITQQHRKNSTDYSFQMHDEDNWGGPNTKSDRTETVDQNSGFITKQIDLVTPGAIQDLEVYLNNMYTQIQPNKFMGQSVRYNQTYQNAGYSNQNYDIKTQSMKSQSPRGKNVAQGRPFEFQKTTTQSPINSQITQNDSQNNGEKQAQQPSKRINKDISTVEGSPKMRSSPKNDSLKNSSAHKTPKAAPKHPMTSPTNKHGDSSKVDNTTHRSLDKPTPITSPKLQSTFDAVILRTQNQGHNATQHTKQSSDGGSFPSRTQRNQQKDPGSNFVTSRDQIETVNQYSSKNKSIETMMPQNYVPHVQSSMQSIQKGQINIADAEEMERPQVPYVEKNKRSTSPADSNFSRGNQKTRYLNAIHNPRNIQRINQLNQEIQTQKIAEFMLSKKSKHTRPKPISSFQNTNRANTSQINNRSIEGNSLEQQSRLTTKQRSFGLPENPIDGSDVLSGSDYRNERGRGAQQAMAQDRNKGNSQNMKDSNQFPETIRNDLTEEQARAEKEELQKLTEELQNMHKRALVRNFRQLMIKAEQKKKDALQMICKFQVGRVPKFETERSNLEQEQKPEDKQPQNSSNQNDRPFTHDVSLRPIKHRNADTTSDQQRSTIPNKKRYRFSSVNFARAQTQAQKMRKRLQYSSQENQREARGDTSVQSRVSYRDKELSRKIEELESMNPSYRQSALLDEALVISGSQEKKLMAYKRMQPHVKIPEVSMRVGPLYPTSNSIYDYQYSDQQYGYNFANSNMNQITQRLLNESTNKHAFNDSIHLQTSRMAKVSSLNTNIINVNAENGNSNLEYRNGNSQGQQHKSSNKTTQRTIPMHGISQNNSTEPKRLSIQGTQYVNFQNSQLEDSLSDDLYFENAFFNQMNPHGIMVGDAHPRKLITVKGYPLSSEQRVSEMGGPEGGRSTQKSGNQTQTQKTQNSMMKNQKGSENFSNEVSNYQKRTLVDESRVNSPQIKYIAQNDMFLGSSSMKKIDEQVSKNVQIQDQRILESQLQSPTAVIDSFSPGQEITTLPRNVKIEQSPASGDTFDNRIVRTKKVTVQSRTSKLHKQNSDAHEQYTKISVQSDNHGTSAPLESISIKDKEDSLVVSNKGSNMNELKASQKHSERLILKSKKDAVTCNDDKQPNCAKSTNNDVQHIQLSQKLEQIKPSNQDEPSICQNMKEAHSLLYNFQKDITPASIPHDGEDSHKVGQSIYYQQNQQQHDKQVMQTSSDISPLLNENYLDSSDAYQYLDQIQVDTLNPIHTNMAFTSGGGGRANAAIGYDYNSDGFRPQNGKQIVFNQVKQFKIETTRSIHSEKDKCHCSRGQRCSHRYQQEQIIKDFLKIQHEKFQQQGSTPREIISQKIMRPGKIKGSGNVKYSLNVQKSGRYTQELYNELQQMNYSMQLYQSAKDNNLTPEQQQIQDFWSQRQARLSSRFNNYHDNSPGAKNRSQRYAKDTVLDLQTSTNEKKASEILSKQFRLNSTNVQDRTKLPRETLKKTQNSQMSSRSKQLKRKSQSSFNNDDLIGFLNSSVVKKNGMDKNNTKQSSKIDSKCQTRILRKDNTASLDDNEIVNYDGSPGLENILKQDDTNSVGLQNSISKELNGMSVRLTNIPNSPKVEDENQIGMYLMKKPAFQTAPNTSKQQKMNQLGPLLRSNNLNKMFHDFKKSLKQSQKIQDMQTRTLPDHIDEIKKRNQSIKVQSGNMFLKVRKNLQNKKVITIEQSNDHWRCRTVCEQLIQPQKQTLMPLQKDQNIKTRLQYLRYLELKRLKLDTKKDGDVKNEQAFKHIDRLFNDHLHHVASVQSDDPQYLANHQVLPAHYLHQQNRSIDVNLIDSNYLTPSQQPQHQPFMINDPQSLLNSPSMGNPKFQSGTAFPPPNAIRQPSVMSANQDQFPARLRQQSNMALSCTLQPTTTHNAHHLGIQGQSYSDMRQDNMVVSPMQKYAEEIRRHRMQKQKTLQAPERQRINGIQDNGQITNTDSSNNNPQKIQPAVVHQKSDENQKPSTQNSLRITEQQIKSKMGKQAHYEQKNGEKS